MKVIKRSKNNYYYIVDLKNNVSCSLSIRGCNMSCGIKELENVNGFITRLRNIGNLSDDEIVNELLHARRIIKKGKAAHIIMSLVEDKYNAKIFEKLAKKKEVKIMKPKVNPNSLNKINVVIM